MAGMGSGTGKSGSKRSGGAPPKTPAKTRVKEASSKSVTAKAGNGTVVAKSKFDTIESPLPVKDARQHIAAIVTKAQSGKRETIITSKTKPILAVRPVSTLSPDELMAVREKVTEQQLRGRDSGGKGKTTFTGVAARRLPVIVEREGSPAAVLIPLGKDGDVQDDLVAAVRKLTAVLSDLVILQEARETLRAGICKVGGQIEALASSIALHDGAAAETIRNQLEALRNVALIFRR